MHVRTCVCTHILCSHICLTLRCMSAICAHADIDPFNFYVVKSTARCLHLLWERPVGASGVVTYAVTVEDADSNKREVSTEETNLDICGLKELTDYTISVNATSNMTVTDTTVVTHATTAGVCVWC